MTGAAAGLLLGLPFLCAQPVAADSAGELFKSAGEAYEKGSYDRAVAEYEKLIADGIAGPSLYYNLGNAYFRLGRRGEAILWYERARRLDPRDKDILHNLDLARSQLQDEEATFGEFLDRLLTPRELGWLITILLWLLCSATGLALLASPLWRPRRPALTAAIVALALCLLWLGARVHDLNAPWAVITRPAAEVRSGPGEQFSVGFTVPSGQRVLILGRRNGWMEIGVPSRSLKGWIIAGSAESIWPVGGWASSI